MVLFSPSELTSVYIALCLLSLSIWDSCSKSSLYNLFFFFLFLKIGHMGDVVVEV